MSEQNGTNVSTKLRQSRQTKQTGTRANTLQHPANDDKEAWKTYWKEQGQLWRTEPEIDIERQKYLAERRKIKTSFKQGIYPFKGIDPKLSRADIEWLLATHENGRGPVFWNDESQRERDGLDLRGADLREVDLQGLPLARIIGGHNARIIIEGRPIMEEQDEAATVHLEGAYLYKAHLEGAYLYKAHLEGANLASVHLEEAYLCNAHLEGTDLILAHLEGAFLNYTHFEKAGFALAHLEGADLVAAHLEGADLHTIFFDGETRLNSIILSNNKYGSASLCDIHWRDVNVAVVDWSMISRLGDENIAKKEKSYYDYQYAARAYRQLSIVLRNQGLNEDAARLTYRAQLMQRKVFWYQRKFAKWLGSLFLDLLSGYGYKVGRCFIAYALVIGLFASIYHLLGNNPAWNKSIVISMTAFHGRGFFPDQFHPGDPQAFAAAIEALVGLLIEITLIVTLTQRLFGK